MVKTNWKFWSSTSPHLDGNFGLDDNARDARCHFLKIDNYKNSFSYGIFSTNTLAMIDKHHIMTESRNIKLSNEKLELFDICFGFKSQRKQNMERIQTHYQIQLQNGLLNKMDLSFFKNCMQHLQFFLKMWVLLRNS